MAENTKKILIAVSDKDDLAAYDRYLRAKGFDATLSRDGFSAIDAALKEHPVIIITEVSSKSNIRDIQPVDGEKIFNFIGNNPATKTIPFIFIAEDVVNIKGFRKDVDSLFIKPINTDELFARINQRLTRKGRLFGAGAAKDIEGRLSQISLVDILQILHMNRKDGILNLTSGDKKGFIYLKGGEILNASVGSAEKEKALFRLLLWGDGRFEFLPRPIDMPPRIQCSLDNLLMEGMRQRDEWEKNKNNFPKPDAALKTKGDFDLSILPKGLKPVIYEALFLIESYPRVCDIVEHCSFPDYEVCQTLSDLIKKDIIEETKADMPTAWAGTAQEVLPLSQALKIKEKIQSDCGKIIMLYSNKDLISSFIDSCKDLPHFTMNRQFTASLEYRNNPFGDVGAVRIYGGTDIVFFAVPISKNMLPLVQLFSGDAIGAVLVSDDVGTDIAKIVKRCFPPSKKMPMVYTFFTKGIKKEDEFKKEFDIEKDAPIFLFNAEAIKVFPIVSSLFESFLKEEPAKGV